MFLELKNLTLALLIEILEGLIFALLLEGHVQVAKSWKVWSALFELEDFTLALAIDLLEDFILAPLLQAIEGEKMDGKTWVSYNWYQTASKAARLETIRSSKELYCLARSVHIGVSDLISKGQGMQILQKVKSKSRSRKWKIKKPKRSRVQIRRS